MLVGVVFEWVCMEKIIGYEGRGEGCWWVGFWCGLSFKKNAKVCIIDVPYMW